MAKIAPPYTETVGKYCKETGQDLKFVTDAIAEHARKLRSNNLDVVAWSWVTAQGKAPPALKADSVPFVMVDKPYLTISEVLNPAGGIAENMGFNVRGYFFNSREWVSKKEQKPGLAITIGDESGIADVAYFGKQVEAIRALDLQETEAVGISQAQLGINPKDQTRGIRCTGNYSETKRIKPSEQNLGPITSIKPTAINTIKVYQSAFIRGLAFDQKPFTYTGCPRCMSKFKEAVPAGLKPDGTPRMGECPGNPEKRRPSCGVVPSTKLNWATIRVNDDEGEIACKFSPDFDIDEEKAKTYLNRYLLVVGSLTDKGDFNASWFVPEDEAEKLNPVQVAPTLTIPATTATIVETTITTPLVTNTPTTTVTVTMPSTPTPVTPSGTAIGPIILRWLKLFAPAPEDAVIKFATTKNVSIDEAKSAVAELVDLGQLVRDQPTGKIRLA